MHILLANTGTRGDIQPYIALGCFLRDRGHEVTLVTHAFYADWIRQHGLRCAELNDEVIDLIRSPEGKALIEGAASFFGMLRIARKVVPKTGPMQRRGLDELGQLAADAKPDLIVYHPKMIGSPDVAEWLGVPALSAFFMPALVPTSAFPSFILPDLKLGSAYNRGTYAFLDRTSWLGTRKTINRWRRVHGLPARGFRRILRQAGERPMPALLAYSPSLFPAPPDWPAWVETTGYWWLPASEDWVPPAELEAFLKAGPPPIYIGFGSIGGRHPERLAAAVLAAVAQAGVRAIVSAGWGGLDFTREILPPEVLAIGDAPHDWLFPRVAGVVHHGGCGTTAAGLRAGCPTLVCPFFADQPFWGRQVHRQGLGPAPIHQKELTADRLTAALRQLATDDAMRTRARAMAAKLAEENGLQRAADFIEHWQGELSAH